MIVGSDLARSGRRREPEQQQLPSLLIPPPLPAPPSKPARRPALAEGEPGGRERAASGPASFPCVKTRAAPRRKPEAHQKQKGPQPVAAAPESIRPGSRPDGSGSGP